MLQYEVAKLLIRDIEATARRRREAEAVGARPERRPLRRFVGRRLVRIGLRLAAAGG
ncbi:MAG: hypothetical protein ACREQM_16045 [Candidatus Dormibacteraceae bacterium]